jgi:hypothetical protein
MYKSLPQAILTVLILGSLAYCSDIYISQNTSGAGSGADCADARSASWLNSNATAGNKYHLCGVFSGAAKSNMLTIPGGAAGNPVMVIFESGTKLTAPVWGPGTGGYPTGGAINVSGSYVLIDGGTNGTIESTLSGAAGTSCPGGTCSYDEPTSGVFLSSSASNVEIKNLTVRNIYLCNNAPACNTSWYTADIFAGPDASSNNISIHDNTLAGAGVGAFIEFSGHAISNIDINHNTISDGYWGIALSAGASGNSTSNVTLRNNTINGCPAWNGQYNNGGSANGYHCDGIILYCTQGSGCPFNIYNNSISETGAVTADIYCTYSTGSGASGSQCTIFNNVLYIDNNTGSGVGGGSAFWAGGNTGPHYLYNNTIVGSSTTPSNYLVMLGQGTIQAMKNNLFTVDHYGVYNYSGSVSSYLKASDYNLYYNLGSSPFFNGSSAISYSAWQSLGYDGHGVTGNPNLDTNYEPQSGSAAIGNGVNLTNLGIAALNSDKTGTARPATGAWDIGANQSSSQSSNVAPPTGLTATVN